MRNELKLPKNQKLVEEALSLAHKITVANAGIQSDFGPALPSTADAVLSVLRGSFEGRTASVKVFDSKEVTAWTVSQFLMVAGKTRWQFYGFETSQSIREIKQRLRIKKEARILEMAVSPQATDLSLMSGRKRL